MKKILTILISCFLVFTSLFVVTACTGNNDDQTGNVDKDFNFTLNKEQTGYVLTSVEDYNETAVVVPSEYDEKPVVAIADNAFKGYNMTSIEIPDSVISIGTNAFANCDLLQYKVEGNAKYLGNSTNQYLYLISVADKTLETLSINSNCKVIACSAFAGYDKLTTVEIPAGIINIGKSAFANCSALANIQVNQNNGTYKAIDGNLYTKDGKTLVLYAVGKTETEFAITSGVTSIGVDAFNGCSALESVTIPDSITSIGDSAFANCAGLNSIVIPTSVTNMGVTVFENSPIENVTAPASLVQFMNKKALKFINVSNGTSISDYAFEHCSALTTVVLPDTINSIGKYAFNGCSSLTDINIPAAVKSIGDSAFAACTSLESIVIPEGIEKLSNSLFFNCTKLSNVQIPSTISEVGWYAFFYCTSLINIELPKSITTIYDYAFQGCTAIDSVRYSGTIDEWVNIEFAKSSSNPLFVDASLYLSEEVESVTSVKINEATKIGNYAFYGCTDVTSVEIPATVTSIGASSFGNCPIESAIIPTTAIKFIPKTDLTTVVINGGSNIDDNAFANCTTLESIELSDTVVSIGASAFSGCTSLTDIEILDSIAGIGDEAFKNCTLLNYNEEHGIKYLGNENNRYLYLVAVNDRTVSGVIINSACKIIGSYAFKDCVNITSIEIPESVEIISTGAFESCYRLVEVINKSEVLTMTCGSSANGNVASYALSVSNREDDYVSKLVFGGNFVALTQEQDTILVAYYGGSGNVTIPSNITKINEYAFYNRAIKSVEISENVKYIGDTAFTGCEIEEAIIPISLVSYIPKSNLKTLIITSGDNIPAFTFESYINLTTVVISDSVTTVGALAFLNCPSLTDIYCYAQSKPEGWNEEWNDTRATVHWGYTGD